MQLLYESDDYLVIYCDPQEATPETPRPGFEILDKIVQKSVYLDGKWAIGFQKYIDKWQKKPPHQEIVDETLGWYTNLAQNPLCYH